MRSSATLWAFPDPRKLMVKSLPSYSEGDRSEYLLDWQNF